MPTPGDFTCPAAELSCGPAALLDRRQGDDFAQLVPAGCANHLLEAEPAGLGQASEGDQPAGVESVLSRDPGGLVLVAAMLATDVSGELHIAAPVGDHH